ncbi:hypothetical protein [Isoptericola sp. AK164]|uniref:hypothetical protein n=1 Tax=Isoptericola sp. AK164 TaxID=3024246 RepID=UPI0024184197|nr:hypothetical protein [Isoptericola sp. AK164]
MTRRVRWSFRRPAAIAAATALLTLSLAAIVLVTATYEGRVERTVARTPLVVSEETSADFRFKHTFGDVERRQFSAVYVEPWSDDAVPPPGLDEWPDPGTVAVSEALLGASAELTARYGTVTAVIDGDGLVVPNERLAYIVPPADVLTTGTWHTASGYGGTNRNHMAGEIWHVKEPEQLVYLAVFALVAPALVLVVGAAQLDERRRRRRYEVLEVLGARPARLWRDQALVLGGPVLAGTGAACAVLLFAALVDLPLWGADYWLQSDDVRRAAGRLTLTAVGGGLAAWLLAAVVSRPTAVRGTRPRSREPRYPGWVAVLAAVVIAVTGREAIQRVSGSTDDAAVWILGGSLVALILTPWVCGWLVRTSGAVVHSVGRRASRPAVLVVGAQSDVSPRSSARLAAACAMVVLLVSQLFALVSMANDLARVTEAAHERYDGIYATIGVPKDPSAQSALDSVVAAVGQDATVLDVRTWGEENDDGRLRFVAEVRGDRAAMADLGFDGESLTPDSPLHGMLELQAMNDIAVNEGSPRIALAEDVQQMLLVVDATGGLDTQELQTAISGISAPPWDVRAPGDLDIGGAELEVHQTRWVAWFGTLGAAMLLAAVSLRTWQAAEEHGKRGAPLAAFTNARGFVAARAWTRGAVVAATTVLAGGVAAYHLSWVVDASGADGSPVRRTILVLCVLAVVAVAGSAAYEARSGRVAVSRWRPGQRETR